MELDDQELKATRILNGAEKESKADKIFEKLGYKDNPVSYGAKRYKNNEYNITFYKNQIMITKLNLGISFIFTPEELKAINKKCKELEWIE